MPKAEERGSTGRRSLEAVLDGPGPRALMAVFAVYGFLLLYANRVSSITWIGDAASYIEVAAAPLFSNSFLLLRPWTVTLFYKLMGHNPTAVVMFQVALHFLCWGMLAYGVMRNMRTSIGRWSALLGVLLFSLSIDVNMWNWVILSESVANSLTAGFLAVVLLLLGGAASTAGKAGAGSGIRRWGAAGVLALCATLWTFTRDVNMFTILFLALCIPSARLSRRVRRRWPAGPSYALSLFFLALFCAQFAMVALSPRQPVAYSLTDDICQRILPDPGARAFFERAGMPASPVLMQFSGRYSDYMRNKRGPSPDPSKIDPAYDEWVESKGMRTYAAYILTHPGKAAGWLWGLRHDMFNPANRHLGKAPVTLVFHVENGKRRLVFPMCSRFTVNGDTPLTEKISRIFYPMSQETWIVAFMLCFLAAVLFFYGGNAVALVPASLLAVVAVNAVVVGLADCVEVQRHSAALAVILRLALWLAVFVAIDESGRFAGRVMPGLKTMLGKELPIGRGAGSNRPSGPARDVGPAVKVWLVLFSLYVFCLLMANQNSSLIFKGDSGDYIYTSTLFLFSLSFFARRPFTVPLLYKVFDQNVLDIAMVQLVVHALCWFLLAYAVFRCMRSRRTAWAAFALILGFSLSVEVNMWNLNILSESVANSLTAALLGCALLYLLYLREARQSSCAPSGFRRWAWPLLIVTLAFFWSFSRDVHPYVLLAFAVALPIVYVFRGARRVFPVILMALFCLSFVGIYGLQSWLLSRSARHPWTYSVTDNVCDRILTDPVALAWFEKAGMPVSGLLLSYKGKANAYSANQSSPEPDSSKMDPRYDAWVLKHGAQTYMKFVATHPATALRWIWDARDLLFSSFDVRQYGVGHFNAVCVVERRKRVFVGALSSRGYVNGDTSLTTPISTYLYPQWPSLWAIASLICLLCAGVFLFTRSPVALVPVVVCGTALLLGALVAIGDSVETVRHAVGAAILLRLAMWLAVLVILDEAVVWKYGRQKPGAR